MRSNSCENVSLARVARTYFVSLIVDVSGNSVSCVVVQVDRFDDSAAHELVAKCHEVVEVPLTNEVVAMDANLFWQPRLTSTPY